MSTSIRTDKTTATFAVSAASQGKARVAVLISGGGTNLQAIIDRWQAGELPHVDPVIVVASKSTAGGLARAERAGIKNIWINKAGEINGEPAACGASAALAINGEPAASDAAAVTAAPAGTAVDDPGLTPFEQTLVAVLEAEQVDIIVLAGFLKILSEAFVKRYPDRIINVHPSLIPSFCGDGFYGLKVHEAALEYGVKVTGATVHFVNEITDGGRIIAQKAVDILPGDTPEILQRRVMEQAEWILLPKAVESVAATIAANR